MPPNGQRLPSIIRYFFLMLFLFIAGFALFAEQMFGPTLRVFADTLSSATTLLNVLFGTVAVYRDMVRTAQETTLAVLFFILYVVWMFFILVNVFLAILNDYYGAAKGAEVHLSASDDLWVPLMTSECL